MRHSNAFARNWIITVVTHLVFLAGVLTSQSAVAQLCCGEEFGVVFSTSPDRAGGLTLDGMTVSGDIYVFTSPTFPLSGINRVFWYLDEVNIKPTSSFSTDRTAPYDFAGGTETLANPFDTTTLADGPHSITAQVVFSGSPRTFSVTVANFVVANAAPPPPPDVPYEFGVSDLPDRTFAAAELAPDPFAPGIFEVLFGQQFIFLGDSSVCTMASCIPILSDAVVDAVTWTFDKGTLTELIVPSGPDGAPGPDTDAPFDLGGTSTVDGSNLGFNFDALAEGLHTLTADILLVDTTTVSVTRTLLSQPLIVALPGTLRGVPVLEDPQLAEGGPIIKNNDAAIALGKAFFWDLATGSDGRQACASCHYHAGADNRILNTVHPRANGTFDIVAAAGEVLEPTDFPFHQFADPLDRNSAILRSVDDQVGSQGLVKKDFAGINLGSDVESSSGPAVPDTVFLDLGADPRRRSTGRNTPTNINAIFNVDCFWDGRAKFVYNGRNPFGERDADASIFVNDSVAGSVPTTELLRTIFSCTASQANGPPLDPTEMSFSDRTFPELGRKLLALRPLATQTVHPEDSVFGTPGELGGGDGMIIGSGAGIIHPSGMGLDDAHSYADLIMLAFQDRLWNGADATIDGATFSMMEANFSMFWGLAIQKWEATLVSDDTVWDDFRDGDAVAQQAKLDAALAQLVTGVPDPAAILTIQETEGMLSFMDGACAVCHGGPVLSAATFPFLQGVIPPGEPPEQVVERMLMEQGQAALELGLPAPSAMYDLGFYNIAIRPTGEDIGRGGTDPFGNPLSFAAQLQSGLITDSGLSDPTSPIFVDPCGFGISPCETINVPIAVLGAFKTPTLRNIELTAPYFHNGGTATLEDVVAFYARGADFAAENIADLDPEVAGIGNLRGNPAGVDALVAFLKTFTDWRVAIEAGPFDHPGILLENGVVVDETGILGGALLPTLQDRLNGPTARPESFFTAVDVPLVVNGVLDNDTDGTADAIQDAQVVPMQDVSNGALVLNTDGSFTYTPDALFRGFDEFAYTAATANPADPRSNMARVSIQVGDAIPAATADDFTTDTNMQLVVASPGVLLNDSDADGDPLTAVLEVGPLNGTLDSFLADGSFMYTPNLDFVGMDSFTYHANDGDDDSNTATVSIDVAPANPSCPTDGTNNVCFSLLADRSSPMLLDGATANGLIYVFISPEFPTNPSAADTRGALFWLDTESRAPSDRFSSDRAAPYDFNDGTATEAFPFDADALAIGQHTIRAEFRLVNGSKIELPTATFTR